MTEKTFEDRVIMLFKKAGWWAAHLNGPEGYPDIIAVNHGQCRFFELKSLHRADWGEMRVSDALELSQAAFVIKNPMVNVQLLVKTDDGCFIAPLSPEIAVRVSEGLRFRDMTMQPWSL